MARKDALLNLHRRLVQRRRDLMKALAADSAEWQKADRSGLDDADVAFDSVRIEMGSQIAQLEYRELMKIERAIASLHEGTYGFCELCEVRIPVARLNALPYTTVCVDCQRRIEEDPSLADEPSHRWEHASHKASDESFSVNELEHRLRSV